MKKAVRRVEQRSEGHDNSIGHEIVVNEATKANRDKAPQVKCKHTKKNDTDVCFERQGFISNDKTCFSFFLEFLCYPRGVFEMPYYTNAAPLDVRKSLVPSVITLNHKRKLCKRCSNMHQSTSTTEDSSHVADFMGLIEKNFSNRTTTSTSLEKDLSNRTSTTVCANTTNESVMISDDDFYQDDDMSIEHTVSSISIPSFSGLSIASVDSLGLSHHDPLGIFVSKRKDNDKLQSQDNPLKLFHTALSHDDQLELLSLSEDTRESKDFKRNDYDVEDTNHDNSILIPSEERNPSDCSEKNGERDEADVNSKFTGTSYSSCRDEASDTVSSKKNVKSHLSLGDDDDKSIEYDINPYHDSFISYGDISSSFSGLADAISYDDDAVQLFDMENIKIRTSFIDDDKADLDDLCDDSVQSISVKSYAIEFK